MATLYTLLPFNETLRPWLQALGVDPGPETLTGRFPTPNEILAILKTLPDYQCEYFIGTQTWQVTVSDLSAADDQVWASLVVTDYRGEPGEDDRPHAFYFEKGWPELMIRILAALSQLTGPLVMIPTSGEEPTVVG
jgi:hypothetical protein